MYVNIICMYNDQHFICIISTDLETDYDSHYIRLCYPLKAILNIVLWQRHLFVHNVSSEGKIEIYRV